MSSVAITPTLGFNPPPAPSFEDVSQMLKENPSILADPMLMTSFIHLVIEHSCISRDEARTFCQEVAQSGSSKPSPPRSGKQSAKQPSTPKADSEAIRTSSRSSKSQAAPPPALPPSLPSPKKSTTRKESSRRVAASPAGKKSKPPAEPVQRKQWDWEALSNGQVSEWYHYSVRQRSGKPTAIHGWVDKLVSF
jgi:hypothetical protein